jgi:hypothetical protein
MAGNQRIMHTHSVLEPFFEAGFDHRVFSNVQTLDFEGLKGRLLSSSYAPLPDQTGHPQMMQELETLFEDHEQRGQVTIEYQTELFVGRPRRHDVRI